MDNSPDPHRHVPTDMSPSARGYHSREIARGKYGELSKILEELDEAFDADAQGDAVMLLVELADMVGAIEGFLERRYPGINVEMLCVHSRNTKRAFEAGHRVPREG